ncbi:MAG TPA: TetR/AcrR family transcriptional regulator [Treponema sp.]|jgi:AcrR family transcriptional regulator|nr:TetR/AcrR family transcriptional regulator [Treponema sp.]HCA20018.1 TetR/AcrR family transcriptional regulator [Treponema sp.]
MAVLVEHEKRKHEILAKSMDLFIEEGYEAVTFQKIADRCGITRTTLYIYFKNKREIFIWSIKDLTSALEKRLVDILNNQSLTVLSCLETFMNAILDECVNNGKLFKILLIYLIQIQKTGENAEERITRRVIRVRHLLNVIIIRGQQSGEIRKDSVKDINDLLYSLLESAVFKLAVVGKNNIDDARRSISFTIDLIRDA